ncbi:MAG TPA: hypothetical protein VM677_01345 [Actinokineospora sp.]|jgi:hypothetical protein|nr:hypothetical protein [Actinokineospora sp.]
MTAALRSAPPLYEPGLLRALRMVEHGRVGAYGVTAPLGLRGDGDEVAPAWLISALFVLRRDGLVTLDPPQGADLWRPAALTTLGTELLAAWTRLTPAGVIQAVGSVTATLHYVATEDSRPRALATDDGPRWMALCRAWTHPTRAPRGSGLPRCARCSAHLVAGAP